MSMRFVLIVTLILAPLSGWGVMDEALRPQEAAAAEAKAVAKKKAIIIPQWMVLRSHQTRKGFWLDYYINGSFPAGSYSGTVPYLQDVDFGDGIIARVGSQVNSGSINVRVKTQNVHTPQLRPSLVDLAPPLYGINDGTASGSIEASIEFFSETNDQPGTASDLFGDLPGIEVETMEPFEGVTDLSEQLFSAQRGFVPLRSRLNFAKPLEMGLGAPFGDADLVISNTVSLTVLTNRNVASGNTNIGELRFQNYVPSGRELMRLYRGY